MNIALLPVDSTYPNLALMKLSAWHKQHGDTVQWYNPLDKYDKVYMAKVFSFTPDYGYYINADEVEKGGTGYDLHKTLPQSIDRIYSRHERNGKFYLIARIKRDGEFVIETIEVSEQQYRKAKEGDLI